MKTFILIILLSISTSCGLPVPGDGPNPPGVVIPDGTYFYSDGIGYAVLIEISEHSSVYAITHSDNAASNSNYQKETGVISYSGGQALLIEDSGQDCSEMAGTWKITVASDLLVLQSTVSEQPFTTLALNNSNLSNAEFVGVGSTELCWGPFD